MSGEHGRRKDLTRLWLARHRGLSLVEVLMTLCILAMVFSGLFQGLHSGYKGTERLGEEIFAQNHAISLLEVLMLVPYSKLPDVPRGTSEAELGDAFEDVTEFTFPGQINPSFLRSVEISEVSQRGSGPGDGAASPYGSLKLIRVEVAWSPRYLAETAEDRRMVFKTLVTDDMEVSR